MSDLDELERRKRELELRKEIAKLENQEKIMDKISNLIITTSKKIKNGQAFVIAWLSSGRKFLDIYVLVAVLLIVYAFATDYF